MRIAKALSTLLVITALCLASCSNSTGPEQVQDDAWPIPTRVISGSVSFPDGVSRDYASLEVLGFAGRAAVGSDGDFSVRVLDTEEPQVVLVVSGDSSPLLLGYIRSDESTTTVDVSSTIEALVVMNPFMTMVSIDDRAEVIEFAMGKYGWDDLSCAIGDALGSGEEGWLDGVSGISEIQLASDISIQALRDFPTGAMSQAGPWVEDAHGDSVACVNPDPVHYVAVFRSVGRADSVVVAVASDRETNALAAGWPPQPHPTGLTRTYLDLGDGTFDVRFYSGDMRTYGAGTGNDLASLANLGRAVTEAVALPSGMEAAPDPNELGVADAGLLALGGPVASSDPYELFDDTVALIEAGADAVAEWLWSGSNDDCAEYLELVCPILRAVGYATEILGGGENRIPFFHRLVTIDPLDVRRITQLDGEMASAGLSAPPVADFSIGSTFIASGADAAFDAGGCTDQDDPAGDLMVRWDWENDGVWDTEWSTAKTATHRFPSSGAYEVVLQVRDPLMLNDSVAHVVSVGGSEGNASHIVIFRDAVPWSPEVPDVLGQMLEVMEFTEGSGPGQYEVRASEQMACSSLVPGEDLVIIQGDQPQAFYSEYAANQVRFMSFVRGGGTMLWEACDLGWQGGSISEAGVVLPGAVELQPYETWYNYVALPGTPMTEGLPSLLYGEYASHEWIQGLPDGATIYVQDDAGHPTLAEYAHGEGWVIVATQPLEWSFYNGWTAGHVMPHAVCCVLGVPLVHDFGDIVKPERAGNGKGSGGTPGPTSRAH